MKPFSYTNRHGTRYYLHIVAGAHGRTYHAMRTSAEGAAKTLPRGLEIRENVHGHVAVRRVRPRLLTLAEEQLLRSTMQKLRPFAYILDIDGKTATIYASAEDRKCFLESIEAEFAEGFADALSKTLAKRWPPELVDMFRAKRKERDARRPRYYPLLRFVLSDRRQRRFSIERVCFSGESTWVRLDVLPLSAAAFKYLPHLGRDSFFDLI